MRRIGQSESAGRRDRSTLNMVSFFITIHAQPPVTEAGPEVTLRGRTHSTLAVSPETLSTTTFEGSFETVMARLASLERMFCEPDGSFVWVSPQGEPAWQLDGNLYDLHQRLLFVDLKGSCPVGPFDQFLNTLGWPATRLLFQLTREAVFLSEAEFRRYAAMEEAA